MRNWTEDQINLALIRHGETKANRERRYLGKTDEGLSPQGIERLKEADRQRKYPRVDVLFSSPMRRCTETAAILYPELEPVLLPEWEEMDFGDFEGKNYLELRGDRRYQEWIDSGGALPFPGGEGREDFIRRSVKGCFRMFGLLSDLSGQGGKQEITVGAIVHGGTVMSLLSTFYGGEYFDYQTENGDGYLCRAGRRGGSIRFTDLRRLKTDSQRRRR